MKDRAIGHIEDKLFGETVLTYMVKHSQFLSLMTMSATCKSFQTIIIALLKSNMPVEFEATVNNALLTFAFTASARRELVNIADAKPEILFLSTAGNISVLQAIINAGDIFLFKAMHAVLSKHGLLGALKQKNFHYVDDCLQPVKEANAQLDNIEHYHDAVGFIADTYKPAQLNYLPFWLIAKMFDTNQEWNEAAALTDTLPVESDAFNAELHTVSDVTTVNILETADDNSNGYLLCRGEVNVAPSVYKTLPVIESRHHDIGMFCSFFSKAQGEIKNMIVQPKVPVLQ